MDAIKFVRERNRMCSNKTCSDCELSPQNNGADLLMCCDFVWQHPAEAIRIVKQWSKKNPAPTRQSEFLKHYPNAELDESTGALVLCPSQVFGIKCPRQDCDLCRKNFWLAPVEEENS